MHDASLCTTMTEEIHFAHANGSNMLAHSARHSPGTNGCNTIRACSANEVPTGISAKRCGHTHAHITPVLQLHSVSAISALMSAQVLTVLGPLEDALLPDMTQIEWFPSSFPQLLGRFLQEEQQRVSAGMQHSMACNFSKWPLMWHLHMRQFGGNYGSYDAR